MSLANQVSLKHRCTVIAERKVVYRSKAVAGLALALVAIPQLVIVFAEFSIHPSSKSVPDASTLSRFLNIYLAPSDDDLDFLPRERRAFVGPGGRSIRRPTEGGHEQAVVPVVHLLQR
jgi:hypothetical protein